MNRKQKLQELLSSIQNDEWPWCNVLHETKNEYGLWAYDAYEGSLDAANALHEALLPGWHWCIDSEDSGVCVFTHLLDDAEVGKDRNPARAWLIAILKALTECCGEENDQT